MPAGHSRELPPHYQFLGLRVIRARPELDKCGKCVVQLVVRPRRRSKDIAFVIGIGTGEARGCNAAHIAKRIKPGAETLSGIAVDDEGELEWYLIDFVWT